MTSSPDKKPRCDGVVRRDIMRIGGLTALSFGLGDFFRWKRLAAETKKPPAARAKSCILIWLDGGPSHLETFDPKPEAPSEVRGPLQSIATKLPGVRISECLPRTAGLLDRLAVIRSVTSPLGEHNFGMHYLMTGHRPSPVVQHPTMGAVVAHRRPESPLLPPNIAVPDFRVGGSKEPGNGFLPVGTRPFSLESDPAKPNFRVKDVDLYRGLDLSRLDRRRRYVQALDAFSRGLDHTKPAQLDPDFERAYRLVASPEAKRAFRLSEETTKLRQRYGPRTVGQSCLLARRLVERGVPFVTVNHRGWDTHTDLYTRLKEGFTGAKIGVGLVPSLDLALSALVQDLDDRGMLDETLVVVMGEFGRTPKTNVNGGRDHWPRVFSVCLAGGGIKGGQVLGASDRVGESPLERPVTPSDLAATIYALLGIDPASELETGDGRTIRLTPTEAQVVKELIG